MASVPLRLTPDLSALSHFRRTLTGWLDLKEWKDYSGLVQRIALAVSGGVDSMALAVLCSQLSVSVPGFRFTAFVVDHKARHDSSIEAEVTKQRLEDIGIKTRILPLQWSRGTPPPRIPNFELLARKLRYRALGKACRTVNTKTLMTAHHKDDVAETVLMSLAAGEKGLLIGGIKPRLRIPECFGMHGVHESGQLESAENQLITARAQGKGENFLSYAQRLEQKEMTMESGGVTVLRPLIEFSKQDLVDICQSAGMSWFEDPTNADSTQTPRNAVRLLLTNHSLPQALRKERIMALWQRKKAKAVLLNRKFHFAERCCQVIAFDVRSGTLDVRFVKQLSLDKPYIAHDHINFEQHVAVRMVESFISSVTPNGIVRLPQLGTVVDALFPQSQYQPSNSTPETLYLTTNGVRLTRKFAPIKETKLHMADAETTSRDQLLPLDPNHVWTLSRQQFANKVPILRFVPFDSPRKMTCIVDRWLQSPRAVAMFEGWSQWELWDGRYWIRIKNKTLYTFIVRPLRPEALRALRSGLSEDCRRDLAATLKEAAPGKTRWTLPAIVKAPVDKTCRGVLVALPSLGRVGRFDHALPGGSEVFDWNIRYKSVSLRSPTSNLEWNRGERGNIRHDKSIYKSWLDS